MKIYDCFTFFNELDLLELRLNILNDYVDKFVIVEADKTYTNLAKPFNFLENKERYKKFEDKIIYITVTNFPKTADAWCNENIQRNAISQGLVDCDDNDIILISDLDEIIAPDLIKQLPELMGKNSPIKTLCQYNLNYFVDTIRTMQPLWFHPKACLYKDFKTSLDDFDYPYNDYTPKCINKGTTANKIRCSRPVEILPFGGWHLSFLGRSEQVKRKLEAYSHQEAKDQILNSLNDSYERIKTTNSDKDFKTINQNIFPKEILDNLKNYPDFFAPTPKEYTVDTKEVMNFDYTRKKYFAYMIKTMFSFGKAKKKRLDKYKEYKTKYEFIKRYYL